MSNKLFKDFISEIEEIIDKEIGIIDERGTIIACSNADRVGMLFDKGEESNFEDDQLILHNGYTINYIGNRSISGYMLFVEGDDHESTQLSKLITLNISKLKKFHDDKYDKSNFVKNILLDNIFPGDVLIKSKELNLKLDVKRVAFLIRTEEYGNFYVHDTLRNLFPAKNKDFVIVLDEYNVVLVKELKDDNDNKTVDKIAKIIVDTLSAEVLVKVYVGIGSVIGNIRELGKSYTEARVALEVGKVFDNDNYIISYSNLGIGRLIYQLPTTLCELFLQEVFKKGSMEELDEETILTINKFFENSLNVSETSRQLYIHRNTLVYRLDKIQRITGMDLRNFEDSITFKVAMMVRKYLDSNSIKI